MEQVALSEDTRAMVRPGTTSGVLGGQGGVSDSHSLCLWPLQRAGANTQPGCASTNPPLLLDPIFPPSDGGRHPQLQLWQVSHIAERSFI